MGKDLKIYGDWWNGMSGLGKLDQKRFYSLDNCDIHSEPGIVKPQLALTSESTTPNEACFSAIVPTGDVYFCSKTTGKIWKRAIADSTYSLVHTNANTVHRGVRYFNGYLWFWTATKLGYFNLDVTWSDSFATFTNSNARGSEEHANALYIADGRYLARVDASNAFSANEFDMPAQFQATELKSIGDDILIGTYVGANISYCKIFLWDSVSTSWSLEDEIFEIGVNCFIQLDNVNVAQCGTSGRFYYWTGSKMNYFTKIRGITTALGEQMSCVLNGRALFANATKIYSIHKEDKDLPYAVCGEYTATGTIGSLIVVGTQLLAHRGTGVDKIGTAYATAVIETPESQKSFNNSLVSYDTYPDGIVISISINTSAYVAQTPIIDTVSRIVSFDGGLADCVVGQVKLTLTPSGANIPKVKSIQLL